MKFALIVMLLPVMLIMGCSSNSTAKTQYYLLSSPTKLMSSEPKTLKSTNKNEESITVTLLELPDYLAQPSLVLQLSDHQLHYSNFHMWAEPLNVGLAQALTHDLNSASKHINFSVSSALKATATSDIVINITAFQATHQSQVILAGNYSLLSKKLMANNNKKNNAFNLAIDLNDSGYPHAVEKMREITQRLAQEISENIAQ